MELTREVWFQAIANGLAIGWLYILMALGLTLILSLMNIMQFAHGEIYMIGAYLVYYISVSLGLNLYLAMFLSMIAMGLFGAFMERFLFRPVEGQFLPPVVISTGLSLILVNFAVVVFGLYRRSIPRLALGSFDIFGSAVPKDRVIAVVFSVTLLLAVFVFLKRTRYGQAMVASSQSFEGSLLQGIDPHLMSRLAFILACVLAAVAGTLAGSILGLSPSMGSPPLVKGVTSIVLGGIGSLLGATIGGLILGLLDGILPVVANSVVTSLAPLVIVILVLLFRPQGLFGHE